MIKSHHGNSNLTSRDVEIFKFLWRFKLATTHALNVRFFEGKSMSATYKRLWHLRKYGYIDLIAEQQNHHFVWTLSKMGFSTLGFQPETLREFGFKAENLRHDILVTAAMVGEFLPRTPESVQFFTEQELRRYHLSNYPEWVPKDQGHRPDGYWLVGFSSAPKTIALEVETNRKKLVEYECVAEYYMVNTSVAKSIWIVQSQGLINAIVESFLKATKGNGFIHNFVSLDSFLERQWLAPVVFGPYKGYSLSTVLGFPPENLSPTLYTPALLDTRKAPIKSTIYKPHSIDKFCN